MYHCHLGLCSEFRLCADREGWLCVATEHEVVQENEHEPSFGTQNCRITFVLQRLEILATARKQRRSLPTNIPFLA